MRVHLPAWVALVSVTAYVACSGSDATKAEQEAGGAAGEGGESSSSGGSSNVAGSKNGGGTQSVVGGQAGEAASGGAAVVGQGGAQGGDDAGMLGGSGPDAGGAGGAGQEPVDMSLPAACPGVIGDYTLKTGTESADHYLVADLGGKQLIFGLGGDDVFDEDYAGQDCLLGGPGDDEFTSSGEFASYFFGGSGADLFHLNNPYGYFHVVDMESADTIGLKQSTFNFLNGSIGSTPSETQLLSLPGYAQGNASIPNGEGAALVYDPNDGTLWRDMDRGDKTSGANQIGTIHNYATYQFDINDFELE